MSAISYTDPDRLMQVVTNLLSNAVKFSPVGGDVEVTVVEAGGNVHIGVRDHGQGIPEEFRPRVFEKLPEPTPPTCVRKAGRVSGSVL